jgi:hypothetical protein
MEKNKLIPKRRRFKSGTILIATLNKEKININAMKLIHLGENYMIIKGIMQ